MKLAQKLFSTLRRTTKSLVRKLVMPFTKVQLLTTSTSSSRKAPRLFQSTVIPSKSRSSLTTSSWCITPSSSKKRPKIRMSKRRQQHWKVVEAKVMIEITMQPWSTTWWELMKMKTMEMKDKTLREKKRLNLTLCEYRACLEQGNHKRSNKKNWMNKIVVFWPLVYKN